MLYDLTVNKKVIDISRKDYGKLFSIYNWVIGLH